MPNKGARNIKGKESESSKARREKLKAETAEGLVKGIREAGGHIPTKGAKFAQEVRDFFNPKKTK